MPARQSPPSRLLNRAALSPAPRAIAPAAATGEVAAAQWVPAGGQGGGHQSPGNWWPAPGGGPAHPAAASERTPVLRRSPAGRRAGPPPVRGAEGPRIPRTSPLPAGAMNTPQHPAHPARSPALEPTPLAVAAAQRGGGGLADGRGRDPARPGCSGAAGGSTAGHGPPCRWATTSAVSRPTGRHWSQPGWWSWCAGPAAAGRCCMAAVTSPTPCSGRSPPAGGRRLPAGLPLAAGGLRGAGGAAPLRRGGGARGGRSGQLLRQCHGRRPGGSRRPQAHRQCPALAAGTAAAARLDPAGTDPDLWRELFPEGPPPPEPLLGWGRSPFPWRQPPGAGTAAGRPRPSARNRPRPAREHSPDGGGALRRGPGPGTATALG